MCGGDDAVYHHPLLVGVSRRWCASAFVRGVVFFLHPSFARVLITTTRAICVLCCGAAAAAARKSISIKD